MPYTINFSKPTLFGKTAITIADSTTNSTGTSLVLLGKGSSPFGDTLWANMVHMLENFCSDTAPSNRTLGQLWYDSTAKKLKLCELDVPGSGTIWTEIGGTPTTPTSYFTPDSNGLSLLNYDLNVATSAKINANLTVVGDTTVGKVTASKAVLSSAKNADNTYMNMITSDDPQFKPYFVTKEYADEHYLKGTNYQNANEFDTSASFDVIKLPGSVIFSGMIKEHTVTVACPAGSNFIDLSGDTFTEGTIFNVTGFQGSSTAGSLPTIKLPSGIDYNGQTITVAISYDGANGRNKVLHAKDMSTGGSGTEARWVGGIGPTTSATGTDLITFRSIADKWYGEVIGLGFA
jgi:hypothetical protein